MAAREPTTEPEEAPGVTFSVYPYELGCDVEPITRVDVDVLAPPGDGRGERVRARCGDWEYEFERLVSGDLVCVEPAGVKIPDWILSAVVEVGAGDVRE